MTTWSVYPIENYNRGMGGYSKLIEVALYMYTGKCDKIRDYLYRPTIFQYKKPVSKR